VFAACVFIGASLIELTIVGYLDRADRRRRRKADLGDPLHDGYDSFTEDVRHNYGTFFHNHSTQNGDGTDRRVPIDQMEEMRRMGTSVQLFYRIFQARYFYRRMRE